MHTNTLVSGPDWCRTSNAAANIASMSSSVSKSLPKDKSLSLSKLHDLGVVFKRY